MKRKALGKGLSALLPELSGAGESQSEVDIDRIDPNPFQPRQQIEETKLRELADSLTKQGLMQPVLVRRVGARYQLIAGERRWRAARLAGLTRVPVVVRQVPEEQLLELALVENIQREELNPIEEAGAYQRLTTELGWSQEQVADRVSKDRSTVANLVRLLKLPTVIRDAIAAQHLSPGHGRPLLALRGADAQVDLAREVVEKGLSVREVEQRVRSLLSETGATEAKGTKKSTASARSDPNTRAAEDRLRQVLGTRVRIVRKGRSGTIELSYHSEEELGRLYEILLRGARGKLSRIR
jgi:ParB family chromosome partitioning protein